MTTQKILIIQLGPFGDVFLSTSYLRALKQTFPDSAITYLVAEHYTGAIEGHPYIDSVRTIKHSQGFLAYMDLLRKLIIIRKNRFDMVIDQQNSTLTRFITVNSGANKRVGWQGKMWESRLTHVAKRFKTGPPYAAYKNLAMVKPLGANPDKPDLQFKITKESTSFVEKFLQSISVNPSDYITIAPGAKEETKKWNISRFARLAELLMAETGFEIIVLYAPDELEDARKLKEMVNARVHISPGTTLNQAIGFIREASLLVCNDTAMNHISVTTGTPVLAIFGKGEIGRWSPASVYNTHRHLYHPDWKQNDSNDFGVTPEEALEEALQLLDEHTDHSMFY